MHNRNPDIVSLAEHIGRSPSAMSWKLANFARLDPTVIARKRTGATHGGKGEIEIWEEFSNDWDSLAFESERLLAQIVGRNIEEVAEISKEELPKEGKERARLVRSRVNQQFFRATVLAAYEYKCCITGLPLPELLTASHIVPWAVDHKNRLNPRNGLCLNAIHDRAFDRGLLTITPDYEVKLAASIRDLDDNEAAKSFLLQYDRSPMTLPHRFIPDTTLLEYHNRSIFRGCNEAGCSK